jgi:hypothetical protein
MPLEGQWVRQQAPLIPTVRRERRVFVTACVLAALLSGLVVWALVAGSTRSADPGCRYKTVASTTGGAVVQVCDFRSRR